MENKINQQQQDESGKVPKIVHFAQNQDEDAQLLSPELAIGTSEIFSPDQKQYSRFTVDVKSEDLILEYDKTKVRVAHLEETMLGASASKLKQKNILRLRKQSSQQILPTYQQEIRDPDVKSENVPPIIIVDNKFAMNTIQFFKIKKRLPSLHGDIDDSDVQECLDLASDKNVKKTQTHNQYDLAPQMIYHEIEKQVRTLIHDILKPVVDRQDIIQNIINKNDAKQEETMVTIDGIIHGLKRQQIEFGKVEFLCQDLLDLQTQFNRFKDKSAGDAIGLDQKYKDVLAKHRSLEESIKNMDKYFTDKENQETKLQKIVDSFKDRMIEKFKTTSDDFTSKLVKMEKRLIEEEQKSLRLEYNIVSNGTAIADVSANVGVIQSQINGMQEDLLIARASQKYEKRIMVLENSLERAKELQELKERELKMWLHDYFLSKDESTKLAVAMQIDFANNLFDLSKHQSNRNPTQKNPKLLTEVQCLVNLVDWQFKINQIKSPFQHFINLANEEKISDSMQVELRKFKTILGSKKLGQVQIRGVSEQIKDRSEIKNLLSQDDQVLALVRMTTKKEWRERQLRSAAIIKPRKHRNIDDLISVKNINSNYRSQPLLLVAAELSHSKSYQKSEIQKQSEKLEEPNRVELSNKDSDKQSFVQYSVQISQNNANQSQEAVSEAKKTISYFQNVETMQNTAQTGFQQTQEVIQDLPQTENQVLSNFGPVQLQEKQLITQIESPTAIKQVVTVNSQMTISQQPIVSQPSSPTSHLLKQKDEEIETKKQIFSKSKAKKKKEMEILFRDEAENTDSDVSNKNQGIEFLKKLQADVYKLKEQQDQFLTHRQLASQLADFKKAFGQQIFDNAVEAAGEAMQDHVKQKLKKLQEQLVAHTNQSIQQLQTELEQQLQSESEIHQNDFNSIVNQHLPALHKKFQQESQQETKTMHLTIQKMKGEILGSVENYTDIVMAFESKVENVHKKFKRISGDWLKMQDRLEKQSENIENQTRIIQQDNDGFTRIICSLVEMQLMQMSLNLQDELDRHQIHLYGLNDTKFNLQDLLTPNFKQIGVRERLIDAASTIAVQLKDECLHCHSSGESQNKIQTAFKMACLKYRSSDVPFRGTRFSRKNLIQTMKELLDNEWSLVIEQKPFNDLITRKLQTEETQDVKPTTIQQFYKQLDHKLATLNEQVEVRLRVNSKKDRATSSLPMIENDNSQVSQMQLNYPTINDSVMQLKSARRKPFKFQNGSPVPALDQSTPNLKSYMYSLKNLSVMSSVQNLAALDSFLQTTDEESVAKHLNQTMGAQSLLQLRQQRNHPQLNSDTKTLSMRNMLSPSPKVNNPQNGQKTQKQYQSQTQLEPLQARSLVGNKRKETDGEVASDFLSENNVGDTLYNKMFQAQQTFQRNTETPNSSKQ